MGVETRVVESETKNSILITYDDRWEIYVWRDTSSDLKLTKVTLRDNLSTRPKSSVATAIHNHSTGNFGFEGHSWSGDDDNYTSRYWPFHYENDPKKILPGYVLMEFFLHLFDNGDYDGG